MPRTRYRWLPDLVRLALTAGDEDTARLALEIAEKDAAREALPGRVAAVGYCRGMLTADAEPVLAAAEDHRRIGRPLAAGQAMETAAVLLAERNDLPRARTAFTEAVELYTGLGAAWDIIRAGSRMRPYGIRRGQRGPRKRPSSGWDALTPTELRVAALVAEGRSNPDIAAELYLSRRTVQTHVSHILGKLGAGSRVEIAAEVAKHPDDLAGQSF